ncbi:MAG: transposase [Clostridia bacterium]|nr:transposase [Clostridia bacterium]
MPRKARKDLGTPFMHVMVQGVNREYIFYTDEYIDTYIEMINKNKKDCKFYILAYCIMNNHAHFLVYAEDINEFGNFMHRTNLMYAQLYNRKEKRTGVLFRNRYQVEPIYKVEYLINCIKYIHNNPVKAKIVQNCEDYKYSSYNDYINNEGVSQNKIMKEIFGSYCNYRKIFENTYEKMYMDISDENSERVNEYIEEGINEYICKQKVEIVEILSNRDKLKELVNFLKKECGIKYVEIRNYLEIPRGTMDLLKIK